MGDHIMRIQDGDAIGDMDSTPASSSDSSSDFVPKKEFAFVLSKKGVGKLLRLSDITQLGSQERGIRIMKMKKKKGGVDADSLEYVRFCARGDSFQIETGDGAIHQLNVSDLVLKMGGISTADIGANEISVAPDSSKGIVDLRLIPSSIVSLK